MDFKQPLLVSISDARKMLGGIGRTHLYRLLDGPLESRKIGSRRLVLVQSILDLVNRADK